MGDLWSSVLTGPWKEESLFTVGSVLSKGFFCLVLKKGISGTLVPGKGEKRQK